MSKFKILIIHLLLIFLFIPSQLFAQTRKSKGYKVGNFTWKDKKSFQNSGAKCRSQMPSSNEISKINSRINKSKTYRDAGSVQVSVYFHVISKGLGISNGDIPDSMIEDQIAVLNASFAGLTNGAGGGGNNVAAVTPFKFVLSGVTRTTNASWYAMSPGSSSEKEAKSALHQDDAKALNIYSSNPSGGILGWATFPWEYSKNPTQDGVVISYTTLPEGSAKQYNEGDTTTHEVGHWFGLFHTFQNGCTLIGDTISDTPAEKTAGYGCPVERDSCTGSRFSGTDPVTNFMDYSDDYCMFGFSAKQAIRIDKAAQIYRGL